MDLRLPIGWLFLILGAILATTGLASSTLVAGLNINLIWGTVLLCFGGGALAVARLSRRGRSSA